MRKFRIITIIILTLSLFFTYSVYTFQKESQRQSLPTLGKVLDFSLLDEKGNPFTENNLKDHIWIANFFFTTCSDICPIMSKNMAALHRSFDLVDGVTLVSITVNPEQDTLEALTQYSKKYNANRNKWRFLTGTREAITDLAVNSFKLGSIDEPVFHSAKFALVDGHGLIRGYYDGVQDGEINQLYQDVTLLLKEK